MLKCRSNPVFLAFFYVFPWSFAFHKDDCFEWPIRIPCSNVRYSTGL